MKQYRAGGSRPSPRRARSGSARVSPARAVPSIEPLDGRLLLSISPGASVAATDFSPVTMGANLNVSRSPAYQGEGTIAIDPTNPSRVFTASETEAGGILAAYSTDAGATWTTRTIADGTDGLGRGDKNPQATFDAFGNLYLSYLETTLQRAVHVAVSFDAGQSFSPLHQLIAPGLDQPSIAAGGDSTAGAASVWITYRNGFGGISAAGARATGKGAAFVGAFGASESAPGAAGNFGDVAVGPDGEVVVTWQTNTGGEGPATIRASTDSDGLGPGGFTSTSAAAAATNVGGFDFLPAQPTRAIDAEGNLAYDLSAGPRRGRLYLVYTDESPDESNDFDVYVRTSGDDGRTWGPAVRVNDDTTKNSQFLPEIAVDPTTGKVAVGWYDARDDAGVAGSGGSIDGVANNDVRYWGAVSTDGGASFLNFPVAAGVSNAAAAGNLNDFGDYTAVAAQGGRVHFGWADGSGALPGNPSRPQMEWATASGTVGPLAGPRVRSSTPAGAVVGAVDHVDVTFDRAMDPATFAAASDVFSFTGPAGSLAPLLAAPTWLDGNRTLRLSFASQATPGNYALTFGPDVRSVAGDAMDQDADGTAGESDSDRYAVTFAITPPRVTGNVPPSPKVGTFTSFDFDFNQAMTTSSFTVADDLVSFTGPGGVDLRAAVTGSSWLNGNKTLRVSFDRQGADGVYTMTIGPRILAAAGGLAMDQDGDFTPGEASDAYTATLTIDRSVGPDAFGYQAWTHAFQNLDLSPAGSGVSTALDGVDDSAAAISLGTSTFNFYGRTYTGDNSLFVSSNGLISFGGGETAFQNTDLTDAPGRPAIAPLWDDWKTDVGTDSRVLYRFDDTDGDGTTDRLVVEWNSVPNAGGSSTNPGTFQAILQLNSAAAPGEIIFNYPDLEVGAVSVLNGAGATVGIKDDGAQGARRLLVAQDVAAGPYVASGKAIRIATTPQPQQAPTITSLGDNPDVVKTGGTVALLAGNVLDVDGSIASVDFYRESNGAGGLQTGAGGDTLIATDTSSASGGYTVTASTVGLADGTYVYYAVATDDDGAASNVAVATNRVDNTPPTVDIVDVSPDPRRDPLGSITIRFNEAVTGVTVSDFTLTRNGGANLLTGSQSVSTSDGGTTWTFNGLTSLTAPAANYVLTLTAANSGIADLAGNALVVGATEAWEKDATVVGRRTFYNQSNFDRVNPAADISDDIAIAADKSALLPGQAASFANITSYSRGINGIMVDVFGLVGTPTNADFQFRVGTGGDPANWKPAPDPLSVVRRAGDGENDSDRITITFPSGSIVNQWLQVTFKATAVTGLPANDVFYFGNLVGETGNIPAGATEAVVNALDLLAARNQTYSQSVPVINRFDFNRDGKINSNDVLVVRSNQAASLALITAPSAAKAASVSGAPRRRVPTVRSQLLFGDAAIG